MHLFLAACALSPLFWVQAQTSPGVSSEILLENELPLSGPQVWLHVPHGRNYRPGLLLPLEGRLVWPGGVPPQAVTGITVVEGQGPHGPRYGVRFAEGGASVFRFPVQAPAGAAELRFSLWQDVHGEPQDLLRTSLVSHLKVLPPKGRVVLRCGQVSRLVVPADWQQAVMHPRELPEQVWMYENVDLVILGREAFKGVSEASLTALRRWVLGGGRVLVVSAEAASADVLLGGVRAGLTPLGRDCEQVPDRPPLWAGMDDDPKSAGCEIRYDGQFNVVYARYRLGLGGGAFFVPSADPNAVAHVGIKVFEEPVLAPLRPERSDVRVWRQPFGFFAPGTVPDGRRMRAGRWALIGAGCVLTLLAYVYSVRMRTRYCAAGLSWVAIGVMASLLVRLFPRPELTMACVQRVDIPLDGRVRRTTEWALCEGTWDPRGVTFRAEPGATLTPLFFNPRELRDSVVTVTGEGELVCGFSSPFLPPSAPLFQSVRIQEMNGGASRTFEVPGEQVRLRVSSVGVEASVKDAIWVSGDGRRLILRHEGATYRCERLTDERRYVRERFPMADQATVGAWAKALEAVLDDARHRGASGLVQCADRLSGDGLIQAQGVGTERGVCFSVQCAEVKQEPLAK